MRFPVTRSIVAPSIAATMVALGTLAGERVALPLHDALGRLRSVHLPAVVVEAAGDPAEAVAGARAAGATEIWAALPAGHPLLGGARPDPKVLREGPDGRVRFAAFSRPSGEDLVLRLPLPDALDGLVIIGDDQLGASSPSGLLEGRTAVLAFAAPEVGVRDAAPGVTRPVDRAHLLAIALGARQADAGLTVLPRTVSVLLVAAAALAWWQVTFRVLPRRGFVLGTMAAATVLLAAVAGRSFGVELPFLGLLGAIALPAAWRLLSAADTALEALDRLAVRLGAPPGDQPLASPLSSLASMAAVYAPGASVAVWRKVPGPGGGVERMGLVVGDGELPDLTRLPLTAEEGPGWRIEPVTEGGEVIGALALATADPLPTELTEVVRGLALTRAAAQPPEDARPDDPITARVLQSRAAGRQALHRAERWEALLAESGIAIGFFDVAGGLVTGGAPLRAAIPSDHPVPMLGMLESLADMQPEEARRVLGEAAAGSRVVPIETDHTPRELVLHALRNGKHHLGYLCWLQDPGAHRGLDALKTVMMQTVGLHLRNSLSAVAGYAAMLATPSGGVEDSRRTRLVEAIVEQVVRSQEILDKAESLAEAAVGDAPIQPVLLPDTVRGVIARLPRANRALIRLAMPEVSPPVVARARPLETSLHALLEDITRDGGHASVHVAPDPEGMVMRIEDDAGGMPQAMLDRQVAETVEPAPPAVARRAVEAMGGTFVAESIPGTGTRFTVRLPYY